MHVSVTLTGNRTFIVFFIGISGEFDRALFDRILARRSRTKLTMRKPNEPDLPPKCAKFQAVNMIS